jgi:hypothetical protein
MHVLILLYRGCVHHKPTVKESLPRFGLTGATKHQEQDSSRCVEGIRHAQLSLSTSSVALVMCVSKFRSPFFEVGLDRGHDAMNRDKLLQVCTT